MRSAKGALAVLLGLGALGYDGRASAEVAPAVPTTASSLDRPEPEPPAVGEAPVVAEPPVVATPRAVAEESAAGVGATAEQQLRDTRARATDEAQQAAKSAVERARVETNSFLFGIFPNSAGFMDARLHARLQYASLLSSGIYLDYTTARAVAEVPTESRAERLVREYRAEADLLKGIFLLTHSSGFAWSLEPGVNGKFIYQDIADSGFNTNSFDETVFRSSELRVAQWVSSAKLDTTVVMGNLLTLDVSGEYLPFIYQSEKGTTVTSQFQDPIDFSIANRVSGYEGSARLELDTNSVGRFTLVGRAYHNEGKVSSQSSVVSGNFEYVFETFDSASREDYWIELIHTAEYVRVFGNLSPAFALGLQRKRIITADDELRADTYKVGLLLEWL